MHVETECSATGEQEENVKAASLNKLVERLTSEDKHGKQQYYS